VPPPKLWAAIKTAVGQMQSNILPEARGLQNFLIKKKLLDLITTKTKNTKTIGEKVSTRHHFYYTNSFCERLHSSFPQHNIFTLFSCYKFSEGGGHIHVGFHQQKL
jgi:hypothetical protein